MSDQSSLQCQLKVGDWDFAEKITVEINDFQKQSEQILSEKFRINSDTDFRVKLVPKYRIEGTITDWLSVYLALCQDLSPGIKNYGIIEYKVFIIDSNGQRKYGRKCELSRYYGQNWGFRKFLDRETILNPKYKLLSANKLILYFEINNLLYENIDRRMLSIDYEKRQTLMQNSNLSDVKFIVKGENFFLHKFILSEKSEVFEAMFRNDMKEQTIREVTIDDIDSNIFKIFIDFLYLNQINDIESNSEPLLYCAEKYNISELKHIIENINTDRIEVKNSVKALILSGDNHLENLEKKAIKFLNENKHLWSEIDSEDWVQLIGKHKVLFDKLVTNVSKK